MLGWHVGWSLGCEDGWVEGWSESWLDGRLDGWSDGWPLGWSLGWWDGCVLGWMLCAGTLADQSDNTFIYKINLMTEEQHQLEREVEMCYLHIAMKNWRD